MFVGIAAVTVAISAFSFIMLMKAVRTKNGKLEDEYTEEAE